jgi:type I restriction enzyme M protein
MYRDTLCEKDAEAEVVFSKPYDVPKQKGAINTWKEKPLADTDLRDSENIPWKQDIDQYFETEVLPFAPDAWMDREKDKIGYEIPFTKYFYEYKPLRDLSLIMKDIEELEEQTEILLEEIKEEA